MSIIVIVDDRVTNRSIFAKLAASIEPNVEVQSFGDPIEALDWLANNTPDLIVTDYKMPHFRRGRVHPALSRDGPRLRDTGRGHYSL